MTKRADNASCYSDLVRLGVEIFNAQILIFNFVRKNLKNFKKIYILFSNTNTRQTAIWSLEKPDRVPIGATGSTQSVPYSTQHWVDPLVCSSAISQRKIIKHRITGTWIRVFFSTLLFPHGTQWVPLLCINHQKFLKSPIDPLVI